MASVSRDRAAAEDAAQDQARKAQADALRVFVYVITKPARPDSVADYTTGVIHVIEGLGWRLEQMTSTRAQELDPAIHTLVFRLM